MTEPPFTLEEICHGCRHAIWNKISRSPALFDCAVNAIEDGADRYSGRCPEREAEEKREE